MNWWKKRKGNESWLVKLGIGRSSGTTFILSTQKRDFLSIEEQVRSIKKSSLNLSTDSFFTPAVTMNGRVIRRIPVKNIRELRDIFKIKLKDLVY